MTEPSLRLEVAGQARAVIFAGTLITHSIEFTATPWPDDVYMFKVKDGDRRGAARLLAALRGDSCPTAGHHFLHEGV